MEPNVLKIKRAVSEYSVEITENRNSVSPAGSSKRSYLGQMPVEECTFTDGRRLFFRPGVNMRSSSEHPTSLRNPQFKPTTCITWLQGETYKAAHDYEFWELLEKY